MKLVHNIDYSVLEKSSAVMPYNLFVTFNLLAGKSRVRTTMNKHWYDKRGVYAVKSKRKLMSQRNGIKILKATCSPSQVSRQLSASGHYSLLASI
jgi:hypothetical protein